MNVHTLRSTSRLISVAPACFISKVLRLFSSSSSEQIIIPNRIKRGPTDILKALSSTVNQDLTAAHYKYHDDPFLIPVSNVNKRAFAMSKESGRKAARWIQAQNADLFEHRVARPEIKDFLPPLTYSENMSVDEEILKHMIRNIQVSDAMMVYEILKKEKKDISAETKQSLLELLCFYNCEEPLPEDHIEERWFRQQDKKAHEKVVKTWKDNGLAESLFNSLEQKDSVTYRIMIQGRAKYGQAEGAWKLYEEAIEKGIPLCTNTFNSLISITNYLRESAELIVNMVMSLLNKMAYLNITPNINTLNSVLEVISTLEQSKEAKQFSFRILAEFKELNIQPSLTAYHYLLQIFCKGRGRKSNILEAIMDDLEGKELQIQNVKDTSFFVTAMEVCRSFQDKDLAYRIDKLLHTGRNYHLIGDSYKESVYYRNFFMLVSATEPVEVFLQMYNDLIPNIYIPEPAVMEEVMNVIEINGSVSHIPRMWSDMVTFGHINRDTLVSKLLKCMVQNISYIEENLQELFRNIALDIWNRAQEIENEEKYNQLRLTGDMFGDIIIILLKTEMFDESVIIMDKLIRDQQKVLGFPSMEALQLFFDACIVHKAADKAITCIEYCADAAFPDIKEMVDKVKEALPLNDAALERLGSIVSGSVPKRELEDTEK